MKVHEDAEKLFQLGTLPVGIAIYRLVGFGQGTIGSYLRESEIKNLKKVLDERKRQLQVIIARKSKGPPVTALVAFAVPIVESLAKHSASFQRPTLVQFGHVPG